MQKNITTKILLTVTIVFFWFAQFVYIPFHTPYILALGATSSFAGIIVGAYGFTQMVLRVPVGMISDRKGRHKRFLMLGLMCAAAASLIRLLCPFPAAFLVANLLSGITSATWVTVTVFYSSLFAEKELKRATGLVLAANNGGILLGFIASLFIGDSIGIWFVFAASIAAAVIGLLIASFVKEETPGEDKADPVRFADIIKNKTLLFYSGMAMLLQVVTASTAIAFTSSFSEQLTSVKSDLSLSMIIFMGVSVLASLAAGRVKRIGSDALLFVLFVSLGVSCALLPFSTTMTEVYLCQGLAGIGNGAIMAISMSRAIQDVPFTCRATVMGIFQAAYGIGMTFGPMMLGALIQGWGYTVGYFGMAAVTLLAVAAIFVKQRSARIKPVPSKL